MGRRTTPVSPARAGGAPQEKPSTREKILAAALSLFAQRGFEETSVQDIALAVGVKAASLYSHFPGKAAIFRAVLSGAMDSWSASIEDCFRGAGAKTSLEEGLSNILHLYVLHATKLESYRFWARVYVFPPPALKKRDFQAFMDLDSRFALKLREYCMKRARGKTRSREIETLVACLVRIAWGFIACVGVEGSDGMKEEMRSEVRLIFKGFNSSLEERK